MMEEMNGDETQVSFMKIAQTSLTTYSSTMNIESDKFMTR